MLDWSVCRRLHLSLAVGMAALCRPFPDAAQRSTRSLDRLDAVHSCWLLVAHSHVARCLLSSATCHHPDDSDSSPRQPRSSLSSPLQPPVFASLASPASAVAMTTTLTQSAMAQPLSAAPSTPQPSIPPSSIALMAARRHEERVQRFAYPPASTPQAYLCVSNWQHIALDKLGLLSLQHHVACCRQFIADNAFCLCLSVRITVNCWARIGTPTSTV